MEALGCSISWNSSERKNLAKKNLFRNNLAAEGCRNVVFFCQISKANGSKSGYLASPPVFRNTWKQGGVLARNSTDGHNIIVATVWTSKFQNFQNKTKHFCNFLL